MSVAVLIGVHDGLVIAADSASTLMVTVSPGGAAGVANVYNNANKIFNFVKGLPIGCVAFGSGSIGNSSVATLIKDIRKKLAQGELGFDRNQYTIEGVAQIVAAAIGEECAKLSPPQATTINLGIFFAGYSTDKGLGESWSVEVKAGVPGAPVQLRPPDQPGINWGGAADVLHRIVLGYSPQLFQVLAEVSTTQGPAQGAAAQGSGQAATSGQGQTGHAAQQLQAQLRPLLAARIQAPIVFAPMPIQDAIDLGRFLVEAACMMSRFSPGPQVVGGPVEIAAITKHEGFKWISRKHYYDRSLNQEPEHVVVDD